MALRDPAARFLAPPAERAVARTAEMGLVRALVPAARRALAVRALVVLPEDERFRALRERALETERALERVRALPDEAAVLFLAERDLAARFGLHTRMRGRRVTHLVICILIFIHQKAGSSKEQTSSIKNKRTNNQTQKYKTRRREIERIHTVEYTRNTHTHTHQHTN